MDNKFQVLKLYLDELGVDLDISEVSSRKLIQKAVYVGQLSGIDLGYRYGWYKLGPYCSALTDDYYELARSLKTDPDAVKDKQLSESIRLTLNSVKSVFDIPKDFQLPKEDWLELVSSYHYLRTVRHKTHELALDVLKAEKARLVPYVEHARKTLEQAKLLA